MFYAALDGSRSGLVVDPACFSESELENRREACHDEYGFTGEVALQTSG